MISMEGVKDYMNAISKIPPSYQIEGVYDALRHNRRLLINLTALWQIVDDLLISEVLRRAKEKDSDSCSNDISGRADA